MFFRSLYRAFNPRALFLPAMVLASHRIMKATVQ
jgi:hypothetical protein